MVCESLTKKERKKELFMKKLKWDDKCIIFWTTCTCLHESESFFEG